MTAKPTLFVTRKLPSPVEIYLKEHFETTLNADDTPLSQEALQFALQNYDALLPTVSDTLSADLLQANISVKILANFGVGVNHIDVEAAKAAGVIVTNTPDVLTDATADIALLLMLSVTRRAFEVERIVRNNEWNGFSPVGFLGVGLQGKTLGVLGFGRIGRAVAERAKAFGMNVIYYSRSPKEYPGAKSSMAEVVRASDFISLHMPGGDENAGVFSAELIAEMKPTAFLINTARGDVVDEKALILALENKRIAGAGLDVFADEPNVPEQLRILDNVTLFPHIGSATFETRTAMGLMAADSLKAFFSGEDVPNRVT